jgi:hypothetical protein
MSILAMAATLVDESPTVVFDQADELVELHTPCWRAPRSDPRAETWALRHVVESDNGPREHGASGPLSNGVR